jgi:hypothetical protein
VGIIPVQGLEPRAQLLELPPRRRAELALTAGALGRAAEREVQGIELDEVVGRADHLLVGPAVEHVAGRSRRDHAPGDPELPASS